MKPETKEALDDPKNAAAKSILIEIISVIRELKTIPSGELYARLMSVMSLDTYNLLIGTLEKQGYIKVSNHFITWIKKEV